MQGAPLEDFPIVVIKLVLLKYLSFRETNIKALPKSIEKLTLLETLDLKQTRVTRLPGGTFRLHHLRHLLVYRYDAKNVTYGAKGVEMLSGRGLIQHTCFAESGLERKIFHEGEDLRFFGLIKVGLKWSRLNVNPLQSLQGLPNLMELYRVDAFTGQTMKFEANTFKKLKILSIEQFSELTVAPVQVNAMPALEKLIFSKCQKLNMLPLGINMLTRLQELLLCDMNREFINRLRKNSEDRNLVSHDRDIHSYTLGEDQLWVRQNLP
ncbi:hypothetical protein NL676_025499 [Syzygium grande]|nr:hypothetical protein NL676_025499 [Syzygium grande]